MICAISSENLDKDRVCRPQTTCTDGRIPVLDQVEGAVCGCPPGKEEVAGSCELLFSQSVCKEGQVLMPETQAVGSKTCSAGFSCRQAKDCEAFTVAKSMMGKKGTIIREGQFRFLKEMICNKKTKSICCPDANLNSLFAAQNLVQSLLALGWSGWKGDLCQEEQEYRPLSHRDIPGRW